MPFEVMKWLLYEFKSSIPEDDAEDAGWRFYSDGFELLPFCPTCSAREFAADAGASDDA